MTLVLFFVVLLALLGDAVLLVALRRIDRAFKDAYSDITQLAAQLETLKAYLKPLHDFSQQPSQRGKPPLQAFSPEAAAAVAQRAKRKPK